MAISREEIFGPIAPLTRFTEEDEAIQLANDTEAGLAAYLSGTKDLAFKDKSHKSHCNTASCEDQ